MRAGRIEQMGTPRQIYREPATAFVADFIGAANLLQPDAIVADGAGSRIRVSDIELVNEMQPLGSAMVAIRPEAVKLYRSAAHEANAFQGRIVESTFLGGQSQYEIDLRGFRLLSASAGEFE